MSLEYLLKTLTYGVTYTRRVEVRLRFLGGSRSFRVQGREPFLLS